MAEPLAASFEEVCFESRAPAGLLLALKGNDFFYGVDRSLVHASAAAFRLALVPAATILFGRRSVSTCIFLIVDGAVQIGNPAASKKFATETLRDGQFTGETSLMPDSEPLHQVTAVCMKSTLLCWARAADLRALLGSEPQIALNVASSLHAHVANALRALDTL